MTAQPTTLPPVGIGARLLRTLCFATLGALTAQNISPTFVARLGGAVLAVLLQVVVLAATGWLLYLVNPHIRHAYGYRGIQTALARGFLLLIPYTVLAAFADLGLAWHAVQTFTAAGMLSAAAATGAELAELGGGRMVNIILLTGVASVLSIVWIALSTLAPLLGA